MTLWIVIDGVRRRVDLATETVTGTQQVLLDGKPVVVDARMLEPGVLSLIVDGRQYAAILKSEEGGDTVVLNGRTFAFETDDPRSLTGRRGAGAGSAGPRPLKAPMPGRVVRVLVTVGDEVEEHQGLVVIEAMKMQNELKSPKAGRVASIAVQLGDAVASGETLVVVE